MPNPAPDRNQYAVTPPPQPETESLNLPTQQHSEGDEEWLDNLYEELKPEAVLVYINYFLARTPAHLQQDMRDMLEADVATPPTPPPEADPEDMTPEAEMSDEQRKARDERKHRYEEAQKRHKEQLTKRGEGRDKRREERKKRYAEVAQRQQERQKEAMEVQTRNQRAPGLRTREHADSERHISGQNDSPAEQERVRRGMDPQHHRDQQNNPMDQGGFRNPDLNEPRPGEHRPGEPRPGVTHQGNQSAGHDQHRGQGQHQGQHQPHEHETPQQKHEREQREQHQGGYGHQSPDQRQQEEQKRIHDQQHREHRQGQE
jgi:hypothetical protein